MCVYRVGLFGLLLVHSLVWRAVSLEVDHLEEWEV